MNFFFNIREIGFRILQNDIRHQSHEYFNFFLYSDRSHEIKTVTVPTQAELRKKVVTRAEEIALRLKTAQNRIA